jgi:cytochrome c
MVRVRLVKARTLLFVQTALLCAMLTACGQSQESELQQATQMTGGDPHAGQRDIRDKGCITCHTLSSVPGARGLIGPSLDGIADRSYLAGELPNIPENMILWILHPHQVEPKTVMPEMDLSEQDSRDIAAYLYMQHMKN